MTSQSIQWVLDPADQSTTTLTPLYTGSRNLVNLHINDEVVRLWLPVAAKLALEQCCHAQTPLDSNYQRVTTVSKYLREFFVTYLYGEHTLLRMRAEQTGLYFVDKSAGGCFYQRSAALDCIPGLGKNIVPLKLKLPSKIKSDLESLATQVNVPLGQFIREILASHLLGHTLRAERAALFDDQQRQTADEWASNQSHQKDLRSINRAEADAQIWDLT